MTETLDDLYLPWLYLQVGVRSIKERASERTHWRLLRQLYNTPFVWVIDMDENRAEDGRALRYEWADNVNFYVDSEWLAHGCSFLEMLVALSKRLAFEGDGHPHVWFWHLLDNIDLVKCNDATDFDPRVVAEIIHTVMWRKYARNGNGGLFPLRHARIDQRKAEIWQQMHAYLLTS